MEQKHNSFKGSLGFVLAAAGSAVGLGNIWRFPYLAAKDGGGLFLVIYIVLALTFGFALLTSEICIGRKTKKSPLTAYNEVHKGFKWLGVLACVVPVVIMPYYCAIGGWVLKYFIVFLTGHGVEAANPDYFTNFITSPVEPVIMFAIFLVLSAVIVLRGVDKGIESFSKIIMPALFVLIIFIAGYSLTLKHTDESGVTRTGLQGLKVLLVPNVENLTAGQFFNTLLDAMGQLFYSLSIAMGIMVAYGSYVRDDTNLVKSINQIEFFDTMVAILAGVMIIPAVFTFSGPEGMSKNGPGLMFKELPKVFMAMGKVGNVVGCLFFAMVLFAAITSSVSIMEAIVASFMDKFQMSRKKASILELVIAAVLGALVCFGYTFLYFDYKLPNGSVGQILDIMDYVSNNVLMPIIALAICILIGWLSKPSVVLDELQKNGENLKRKGLYKVMIKFVAPVLLLILFLISTGIVKFG